jgi:hypothetical protein
VRLYFCNASTRRESRAEHGTAARPKLSKAPFKYRKRTPEEFRRGFCRNPEEVWWNFEAELGPPNSMTVDQLNQCLRSLLRFAEITGENYLRVPPEVANRVLSILIDRLRRSAKSKRLIESKERIIVISRLLTQWRRATFKPGTGRPRKNWFERLVQDEAVHNFKRRRSQLTECSFNRDDAEHKAAAEIAPDYKVKPATLISWSCHPGRRRSRSRKR